MIQPQTVRARVSGVFAEAPGVVTLRLDLAGQTFEYRSGMAINIDPHQFPELAPRIAELESLSPVMDRSFSLASTPLDPGFIEITVKEEEAGALLTPYLIRRLKAGEPIAFSGPFGKYILPDPMPVGIPGIVHVVAGSGIAPNRGILLHCLRAGLVLKHLFMIQNRRPEDIIYRGEFEELSRVHADRLKVVHLISRPQESRQPWSGRIGHLTAELIRLESAGVLDLSNALAFVCGPNRTNEGRPGFIDSFAGIRRKNQSGVLGQLGIPVERIIVETW